MSIFLDSELTATERGEDARFRIIPVPLERTVSYGSGTAAGPAATPPSRHLLALVILDVGEGHAQRTIHLELQHERRRGHEHRGSASLRQYFVPRSAGRAIRNGPHSDAVAVNRTAEDGQHRNPGSTA